MEEQLAKMYVVIINIEIDFVNAAFPIGACRILWNKEAFGQTERHFKLHIHTI